LRVAGQQLFQTVAQLGVPGARLFEERGAFGRVGPPCSTISDDAVTQMTQECDGLSVRSFFGIEWDDAGKFVLCASALGLASIVMAQ
jgi:hypothetical protein